MLCTSLVLIKIGSHVGTSSLIEVGFTFLFFSLLLTLFYPSSTNRSDNHQPPGDICEMRKEVVTCKHQDYRNIVVHLYAPIRPNLFLSFTFFAAWLELCFAPFSVCPLFSLLLITLPRPPIHTKG